MAGYDLSGMEEGRRQLEEICFKLNEIRERVDVLSHSLRIREQCPGAAEYLKKARESLDIQIEAFIAMEEGTEEAAAIYRLARQQMIRLFDLEEIRYPETLFGVNSLSGLDQYRDLISFLPPKE